MKGWWIRSVVSNSQEYSLTTRIPTFIFHNVHQLYEIYTSLIYVHIIHTHTHHILISYTYIYIHMYDMYTYVYMHTIYLHIYIYTYYIYIRIIRIAYHGNVGDCWPCPCGWNPQTVPEPSSGGGVGSQRACHLHP